MSGLILPPGMKSPVVGNPTDLNSPAKMSISSAPYINAPEPIKMFLRNAMAANQQGRVTPQLDMALSGMHLYWVVYNNVPVMVYLLQVSALEVGTGRRPAYLENQIVPLPELQKAMLLYGPKGAPAKMQEISKFLVDGTVRSILTKEKKVLINPQTGVIILPTFHESTDESFALTTIIPSANMPVFGVEYGETFLLTTMLVKSDMSESRVSARAVVAVEKSNFFLDAYRGPDYEDNGDRGIVMRGITEALKVTNTFLLAAKHTPCPHRGSGRLPASLVDIIYKEAPPAPAAAPAP